MSRTVRGSVVFPVALSSEKTVLGISILYMSSSYYNFTTKTNVFNEILQFHSQSEILVVLGKTWGLIRDLALISPSSSTLTNTWSCLIMPQVKPFHPSFMPFSIFYIQPLVHRPLPTVLRGPSMCL